MWRDAYSSSYRAPPMESGWRKETAVPWASDWTYLSTHGRRAALREVRRAGPEARIVWSAGAGE